MSGTRNGHVLLVEDSADDRFLLERAIRRAPVQVTLSTARDGDEAVDYLAGAGEFTDRERHPLPALILLDWKLPKRTGREVLEWLRARPRFLTLPVVVLTTSAEVQDVHEAYAARANSYLPKLGNSGELAELMACTLVYWLRFNLQTPPEAGGHC
ncbi:MAG TPA: response regulator [Lysobacter sp.]|nr:response regulator [Lysobacter sp.]